MATPYTVVLRQPAAVASSPFSTDFAVDFGGGASYYNVALWQGTLQVVLDASSSCDWLWATSLYSNAGTEVSSTSLANASPGIDPSRLSQILSAIFVDTGGTAVSDYAVLSDRMALIAVSAQGLESDFNATFSNTLGAAADWSIIYSFDSMAPQDGLSLASTDGVSPQSIAGSIALSQIYPTDRYTVAFSDITLGQSSAASPFLSCISQIEESGSTALASTFFSDPSSAAYWNSSVASGWSNSLGANWGSHNDFAATLLGAQIGSAEWMLSVARISDALLPTDWLSPVAPPAVLSTAEWSGSLGQVLITPAVDWLAALQADAGTSQAQWTIPSRYDWASLAEWGRSTDAASSGSIGALISTESNSLFWSAPLNLSAADVPLSPEFAGITATISDLVSPIDWRGGIAAGPSTQGDWSTNLQINPQSLAEWSATAGQSPSVFSERQIAANRAVSSDLEATSTFYRTAESPAQWSSALWQTATAPSAAQNDVSATVPNHLSYQYSWSADLLATSDIQQAVNLDGEMTTPVDASLDIALTGLVGIYRTQYLDWRSQTSLLAASGQVSEYPIEIAATQTGDALSSESSIGMDFGVLRYSAAWVQSEWGGRPTRHAPAAKGSAVFTRPPQIVSEIRTSTARAKGASAVAPSWPGRPK